MPLLVFGVLAAGLLCVLYGIAVEHHWYRVRRYRLDILPASAPAPVSILHVSDLHLLRRDRRLRRFLASLPRCDVTVATGDLVGEPEAVEEAVAALAPVRGRLASLFVLGSNDYFRPRPLNPFRYFRHHPGRRRPALRGRGTELASLLAADGWTHLKNVHGELDLGGLAVEVAGMDDPHIHRADLRVTPRRRPGLFGLAVVHSPDPAPELAALGWDLILAGHTHGGQVRLPGVGALVTNSHMPRRFAGGLARIGGAVLHTSPGLGTSRFAPFRFLCRPEAAILELHPATDPDHTPGAPGSRAASRAGASPD
ncbi:MAG: metallophosphoesterase [Actinomycetota bacterium]